MGSSLYTRKQAVVNAVEARVFAKPKEIQDAAVCRQDYGLCFLGHSGSCSCGLCASRTYYECRWLLYITVWSPAASSPQKATGFAEKGVILQHDNAPPHRARQTVDKIEKMGWELLQHPPYSPDLVPSYFHLFIYWKNLLEASILRTMKRFNSFYVQPIKISMLQAAADL